MEASEVITLNTLNKSVDFKPFKYLQIANKLLSNPFQEKDGREFIIRALASKEKFIGHEDLLRNLVRKSGLYPYLSSEFHNLSLSEKIATDIHKAPELEDFVFHSMQLKIYNLLMDRCNVVLSAPTSMGKSAVIDSIIASDKFNTIVIVVPTIALIDETRRRISKKFSSDYQIIYHSAQESQKSSQTEVQKRIFILTQERVNERNDFNHIDIFIIDEFYKLSFKKKGDRVFFDERVISLNLALSKLLTLSDQFYMIGPNIDFIRGLRDLKNNYIFLHSDFNTVALNVFEYNLKANDISSKDKVVLKILSKNTGQTIIYCKSPTVAENIAKTLTIYKSYEPANENNYVEWLKDNFSEHWGYTKAINNGIGIHYGTLPRAIQQYTIELFNLKKVKILICTSTIIEGVNTNAENVIIYDNRDGNGSIDKFTHNNIKGRAGRMKEHFIGNVHCLENVPTDKNNENTIDIPLGLQDETTPLNLIAGIQPDHVDAFSKKRLDDYLDTVSVPGDIIKKNVAYSVDIINEVFNLINIEDNYFISLLCFRRFPEKAAMNIIVKAIVTMSRETLRRNSLSQDYDTLGSLLYVYLNSSSHQNYFKKQLDRIINTQNDKLNISEQINRELKIIRNVYSYVIPKAMTLIQDIVSYICESRNLNIKPDFSHVINTFEKFHLPGNTSAVEEMGIPIQALEKITFPDDAILDINKIITHIKNNYEDNKKLNIIEKRMIEIALM